MTIGSNVLYAELVVRAESPESFFDISSLWLQEALRDFAPDLYSELCRSPQMNRKALADTTGKIPKGEPGSVWACFIQKNDFARPISKPLLYSKKSLTKILAALGGQPPLTQLIVEPLDDEGFPLPGLTWVTA